MPTKAKLILLFKNGEPQKTCIPLGGTYLHVSSLSVGVPLGLTTVYKEATLEKFDSKVL